MEFVMNQLNNLCLDYLDYGWVKAIYHSEFLEFGDLPPEYETTIESLDLKLTFKELIRTTEYWLNSETEVNEEKSWATLSRLIQHEKILAILGYYIDLGNKNIRTKEYRNNAILASRVYYKLLSIPGYKAYHIYHSQLFVHSLACLGFPKAMCDEESHFNTKELTREVNSVIKGLKQFVLDLRAIIEHLQLNPSDMNFEEILSNLVDITGGAIVNKLHVDKIELTTMSGVIYEIIDILICGVTKEPNAVAIELLFKCLLPKLVASSLDNRSANNLVKASYVTYSSLVLSKYGKAALSGYMVLLEHICHSLDGLERAEVRNARVSLVVGLMSLLPRKSYSKFVKWLLKLSTTAKISHRQIAMEMLAALLSNDPEPPESIPAPTIAENNEQGSEPQPIQEGNDQVVTTNQNTDDESSQSSQPSIRADSEAEMEVDDIADLLCQRPHTVPHLEILRALYERVNDESSTLRTRAVLIFADCVTSDRAPVIKAIKELQGDGEASRLAAVAARSVCDERAAVRKAGAVLLQRLLSDSHAPPPQPTNLQILVKLCRDGSVLVRTTAIAAVGELVTLRPSEIVFNAFLRGPMHQLSDPENKVQEQVVLLIRQMLIDRLRKFTPDCADLLPWMILAAILSQKMDKHLQKACVMLSNAANCCINHRLVDIVSTHLGVLDQERDLQCLLLLTSVAKHVDYSDIAFVLDYYYKIAESKEDSDVRIMPLTLDLLTSWARFAQPEQRSKLRNYLVGKLAAARDSGCRINEAILAAHLDPQNLRWATELMQLSERRALESGDVLEALRAADLSLVAPEPPSPALLQLFLRGVNDPPPGNLQTIIIFTLLKGKIH